MSYDKGELRMIYDRTDGRCHVCRMKLCFVNYGVTEGRAPWEVDHSVAKARGGSDRISNLLPACPSCNRSKRAADNRRVRSVHGHVTKPLSKQDRATARTWNILGGGTAGAAAGALVFGPVGGIIGGLLGAAMGHDAEVG